MLVDWDYLALTVGTIGTILWAHNGKWTHYAAIFWFISSILWIVFAYTHDLPALSIRDAISIVLYLYGAWRWIYNKKVIESN